MTHEELMNQALKLIKDSDIKTWPNPIVGCIITDKNNNILYHGVTELYGRPHAEKIALQNLKNPNSAHNMYVTLEPCCYTSQQNSDTCVDLILKSLIKNVYIGMKDPNLNICGRSVQILKNAGINVKIGFCQNEIFKINFGFFSKHLNQRAQISVKIATSLDGKIALKNNKSQWITCEKSRNYVHILRSHYDAILTTNKTVLFDNPQLTVREDGKNISIQPVRIILDRNLSTIDILDLNIFKKNNENPNCNGVIVVCEDNNKTKENIMKVEHINFLSLKDFSLANIIKELTKNFGFNKIFVECGGKLLTSLLRDNLIDKIYWFHSNKIIGNDGIAAIGELNYDNFNIEMESYYIDSVERFDNDVLTTFINKKNYDELFDKCVYKDL